MSWCLVGSEMCIRDSSVTSLFSLLTFFNVASKLIESPLMNCVLLKTIDKEVSEI
jgi:hypothetical protein